MENIKRNIAVLVALMITSCAIMGMVDGVIQPDYWTKSVIKIMLFGVLTVGYVAKTDGIMHIKELFYAPRRTVVKCLLFGVGVYIFILLSYFTIGMFFDFSNIVPDLANRGNIHKENFVWVSLYISFVNSLLEEFFFRGICFLYLGRFFKKGFCYVFSSMLFSLYHVSFMASWFSLPLFLLLVFSLFAVGLLFSFMDDKSESLLCSWTVHVFANLSINTIGFMLFGLI